MSAEDDVIMLENLKQGFLNKIQVTRSNMDEGFHTRTRKYLVDQIQSLQKQLDDLDQAYEHGEEIIADSQAQVQKLNVRIKKAQRARDVERLKEMERKINELASDTSQPTCENTLHSSTTTRVCGKPATAVHATCDGVIAVCEHCKEELVNADKMQAVQP